VATYATVADLRAYVLDSGVLVAHDDPSAERVLQRAERDVDRLLGPYPVLTTGRKRDPVLLTAPQQQALARATCAAAEFRIAMGEDELVGVEDGIAAAGPVTFSKNPITRVAPKALEELAGSGLVTYSGTVSESMTT
jgi:hypothetical protein